jgi:putative ABC transport system permease protein
MLGFKLFFRDLLSGGSTMLIICLIIAVSSLTTVGLFTDRVRQAITQEASESLAADIRIESDTPIQDQLIQDAQVVGLTRADIISFRSVVMNSLSSSLVDVRGVSSLYPLRGELQISDSLMGLPYLTIDTPKANEVWAEASLLVRLGLDVGDVITIGSMEATVTHVLDFRPDEGWRFMEIAPTILLNIDDIDKTKLVLPGSRVEYELLLAGTEAQVQQYRDSYLTSLLPGQEYEDVSDARPEVRTSLIRAEQFLNLSALITVILCGIAILMASKEFVSRHEKTVAILRVFGCKYKSILGIIATQLLLVVTASTIVGLILGWLCQYVLASLGSGLIETTLPSPTLESMLIAPVTAVFVTLGFAFVPMLSLKDISPLRLLRNDVTTSPSSSRVYFIFTFIFTSLCVLLNLILKDAELLIYVALVIVLAALVLVIASYALVRASSYIKNYFSGSWRYGISNISRRAANSTIQLIAFGLSITAILILTIVRVQLLDTWQGAIPEYTPNYFLINIQPGDEKFIETTLSEYGINKVIFYPITRARISHVNNIALSDFEARDEEAADELRDDINLTWSQDIPAGNELIEGSWWDTNSIRPQISIASRLMEEIGLSIGDTLTFYLSGESLTAEIVNIRSVNWESFSPNFFMLLNPGTLENYSYTSISSFYLDGPSARQAIVDLSNNVPSVSTIEIGSVISQVQGAMKQASLAVQFVFLFTLVAAFLVMLTTIHVTKRDRIYEGSLIKAIGGSTKTVRTSLLVEFITIGSLAGLLGSFIAIISGYILATEVLDIAYQFNWLILLFGVIGGGCFVGISSFFVTHTIAQKAPITVLRESYD